MAVKKVKGFLRVKVRFFCKRVIKGYYDGIESCQAMKRRVFWSTIPKR